jgi:hypothetical protein
MMLHCADCVCCSEQYDVCSVSYCHNPLKLICMAVVYCNIVSQLVVAVATESDSDSMHLILEVKVQ